MHNHTYSAKNDLSDEFGGSADAELTGVGLVGIFGIFAMQDDFFLCGNVV